ncbi:hypothetical protein PEZ76_10340 [Streptococcus thermophilus]|nr:hypothetical protein [Streptococcus thermophilus]MDA3674448.1 hypothetical protein [Streptococcus thermophilus]
MLAMKITPKSKWKLRKRLSQNGILINKIILCGRGVFFMMMRLDNFFVEEMQKNGFDVDFKRLKQIYLDSRNRHSDDIEKGKVRALNERLKYED